MHDSDIVIVDLLVLYLFGILRTTFCFMHFCPGTTHAESINSDLQRGLDRHLRNTQH